MIHITLPDGSQREYPGPVTVAEVAASIGTGLAKAALAGKVGTGDDAKVVASGSSMFPHQPGAVLVVREKLIKQNPSYVQQLVAAHVQATQLLHDKPEQAASSVQKFVGGGRLPLNVVLQALKNSRENFVADPHQIVKSTQAMHDFQVTMGTLQGKLDVGSLFDTQFYDHLKPAAK